LYYNIIIKYDNKEQKLTPIGEIEKVKVKRLALTWTGHDLGFITIPNRNLPNERDSRDLTVPRAPVVGISLTTGRQRLSWLLGACLIANQRRRCVGGEVLLHRDILVSSLIVTTIRYVKP